MWLRDGMNRAKHMYFSHFNVGEETARLQVSEQMKQVKLCASAYHKALHGSFRSST